jgi:hypothetical protein
MKQELLAGKKAKPKKDGSVVKLSKADSDY